LGNHDSYSDQKKKTVSNLRETLSQTDLERNFPSFLGLNRVLHSVMPAQAGIQCFGTLLDSRFRGNDKPAPCEYLGNVKV
jgi:hypothetical protein